MTRSPGPATFAAIRAGDELPGLTVAIGRRDLVRFAGGADDYEPQHWDHPMMIAAGFDDVVVHGWLCCAHMLRCVTDWAPPRLAAIEAYEVTYRRPLYPGIVTFGGTVEEAGPERAHLRLWACDAAGNRVSLASVELVPTAGAPAAAVENA